MHGRSPSDIVSQHILLLIGSSDNFAIHSRKECSCTSACTKWRDNEKKCCLICKWSTNFKRTGEMLLLVLPCPSLQPCGELKLTEVQERGSLSIRTSNRTSSSKHSSESRFSGCCIIESGKRGVSFWGEGDPCFVWGAMIFVHGPP